MIVWDWLPADWTADERYYRYDKWYTTEIMQEANVKEEYDYITGNLDALLKEHGYVREGHYYRAEGPNNDTLVFFCHFGVGCMLLSHLFQCGRPWCCSTISAQRQAL